jgi:DNA repair exonuclease SbcCD ATPase subunit
MKTKFISIKFKNILSYGNKVSDFDFSTGLNSITGRNGQGKSSIIDILSYNLFGQPFRKIKIMELVNRTNQKNMWTESEFEIDGNSFKIIRGIKPNIFKIYRNGKELELLSSKRLIQDEIDDILGINYNLFRQIIVLSVNANKPFLTLSAYEKRNIVETIFNIDVFGLMTREVKRKLADLKVEQNIKTNELNYSETNYSSIDRQLTEYTLIKKNFDKNKKNDLSKIQKQHDKTLSQIEKCEQHITIGDEAKSVLNIVDMTDNKKKRSDLNNTISNNSYDITRLENDNKFLENNDDCIYCGHTITTAHRNKHLKKNSLTIKAKLKQNDSLNNDESKLNDIITANDEQIKSLSGIDAALTKEKDKIELYTNELVRINKNKTDIEDRKIVFDIDHVKDQMKKRKREHEILSAQVSDINADIDMQTMLSDILSETGVKSHFLEKLLPLLNTKVNEYLELFEMPFLFTFDKLLEPKIVPLIGKSVPISYNSCSEGEKKRFDLSILFSFIDIIKTISSWDCNLLFIDELLDSALDSANLILILESIRKMTRKDKTRSLYIISHRSDQRGWDKIVTIEKKGTFSQITINS